MKKFGKKYFWSARRQKIILIKQKRKSGKIISSKWSVIKMPSGIIIHHPDGRKKLIKIFNSMNKITSGGGKVKLDFSITKKIHPGGMLVLMSNIEIINSRCVGGVNIRCAPESIPAQLFDHFNYTAGLGLPKKRRKIENKMVTKWNYLSGRDSDGSKISGLLANYRSTCTSETPEGLYESLTEAITNVKHHAYLDKNSEESKWWIFSSHDDQGEDQDHSILYIAVYDRGIGIQKAMRRNPQWEETVTKFLLSETFRESWLEKKLLQEAVEMERSSTGMSHRGKGLPDMKEFVAFTRTGSMYIMSGRAQYTYTASTQTSDCTLCDDELPGTLILWSIPLQKVKANCA